MRGGTQKLLALCALAWGSLAVGGQSFARAADTFEALPPIGPTAPASPTAPLPKLPEPKPQSHAGHPLQIPPEVPGSQSPLIILPPSVIGAPSAERRAVLQGLYRPLPEITPEPAAQPGPDGQPLTLETLEDRAVGASPDVRQARADVQSNQGTAQQAGMWSNPHLGYEADNLGTGNTAGYQGLNFSQTIPTGGKLRLARAAAEIDVKNAELTLARTERDVATQVRTRYFNLLSARQRIRVMRALTQFIEELYRVQIERVVAGEAAPYEPLQMRQQAQQARNNEDQAVRDYVAAWRQLAATLNAPDMPLAAVAGDLEQPPPTITYAAACRTMLARHPNLAMAENGVRRAQYRLRLAEVTPWVPDVDTSGAVQKDFTAAPYNTTVNVQIGATVPLWDRNRGAILSAQGDLARANQEYQRARNALLITLADAYDRYATNRQLAAAYRDALIPDEVRVFRGTYQRHEQDPDAVSFNDVATEQQNLINVETSYLQVLTNLWQAVVDVADVMQACRLGDVADPLEQVPAAPAVAPSESVPAPAPLQGASVAPGERGTSAP